MRSGLFTQLVIVPLFRDHGILTPGRGRPPERAQDPAAAHHDRRAGRTSSSTRSTRCSRARTIAGAALGRRPLACNPGPARPPLNPGRSTVGPVPYVAGAWPRRRPISPSPTGSCSVSSPRPHARLAHRARPARRRTRRPGSDRAPTDRLPLVEHAHRAGLHRGVRRRRRAPAARSGTILRATRRGRAALSAAGSTPRSSTSATYAPLSLSSSRSLARSEQLIPGRWSNARSRISLPWCRPVTARAGGAGFRSRAGRAGAGSRPWPSTASCTRFSSTRAP